MLNELITDFFSGRAAQGLERLQAAGTGDPTAPLLSGLRLAVQQPGQTMLYYTKLYNIWQNWGRPALKPNVARRKIVLLSDFTADGFAPLISIFSAAWGIECAVRVPAFDSVEQLAFGGAGSLEVDGETIVVLMLSEQWLSRYLGSEWLVSEEKLQRAQSSCRAIVERIRDWGAGHVLLANIAGRAYPAPGSVVTHGSSMGWNLACGRFNTWLASLVASDTHLVDLAQAVFAAGGAAALGQLSHFRARMAYEPAGTVAAAREIASAAASLCGKTHRAIVTDWDNTLWGGQVAEVGNFGVVCGVDSPEGLAYWRVQDYLKGLKQLGIVLAGVSRNDPKVQAVFEENNQLALRLDDFASLQVSFRPKSESILQVSKDLGFGVEFMLFLDDSLFELSEAVTRHPDLDVLRAGPDGESTLAALCRARPGNVVSLSDEDLQRASAAQSLKKQRDAQSEFTNLEEFLQNIHIELQVTGVDDRNLPRVVQMFQKSNQFNLTTRRHGEKEIRELLARGARVGVFSYTDSFGPQGIISVVVLVPEGSDARIESWLMSCRVLNRTVEEAVFEWTLEQAGTRRIVGQYIPTQKNGLVRDLLPRLGFERTGQDESTGVQDYEFRPAAIELRPRHFAQLKAAA